MSVCSDVDLTTHFCEGKCATFLSWCSSSYSSEVFVRLLVRVQTASSCVRVHWCRSVCSNYTLLPCCFICLLLADEIRRAKVFSRNSEIRQLLKCWMQRKSLPCENVGRCWAADLFYNSLMHWHVKWKASPGFIGMFFCLAFCHIQIARCNRCCWRFIARNSVLYRASVVSMQWMSVVNWNYLYGLNRRFHVSNERLGLFRQTWFWKFTALVTFLMSRHSMFLHLFRSFQSTSLW